MNYKRNSASKHTVVWEPDDREAAARAVAASDVGGDSAAEAAKDLADPDSLDFRTHDDGGDVASASIREQYKQLLIGGN